MYAFSLDRSIAREVVIDDVADNRNFHMAQLEVMWLQTVIRNVPKQFLCGLVGT